MCIRKCLEWIFPRIECDFSSPYSADETIRKLDAAIPRFTIANIFKFSFKDTEFLKLSNDKIRVHCNKAYSRNGFAPVYYGTVKSEGNGAKITGEFRQFTYTRSFIAVALPLIGIIGMILAWSFLVHPKTTQPRAMDMGWLIPMGMVVFYVLLSHYGFVLTRRHMEQISKTIKEVLK